jgi:hypothetical protein
VGILAHPSDKRRPPIAIGGSPSIAHSLTHQGDRSNVNLLHRLSKDGKAFALRSFNAEKGHLMGRGDQLARQWRIIQTLISSKHGRPVADLVNDKNCHPRTIYRELEALQEAGFPIYQERRGGGSFSSPLGQVGSCEETGTLLTLFVNSGMYDGGVHS